MTVFTATRMPLLVRCVLGPSLLFGFSPLVHALSVVGPGQTETLNPGALADDWILQNGSTLNVNGATTLTINGTNATLNISDGSSTQAVGITAGSQADITGATIAAGAGSSFGLSLSDSQAQIVNTTIDATSNANGTGLVLSQVGVGGTGSAVSVSGGSITGSAGGISTSALSTLTLENVQVTGVGADSYGLRAFSSDVDVTGGSI